MVPAGNKAERLPSVNHSAKTIHHHTDLPKLNPNQIVILMQLRDIFCYSQRLQVKSC